MAKIKAASPVVELDGDEMTRIIWRSIKEQLILPYLDIELEYFDLGIEHRDATGDRVTVDAAHAVREHGAGVKCPTIAPDRACVEEFHLKAAYRSPDDTLREILGGVVFHEPVVIGAVRRRVPGWREPVVIGRHTFGDQHRATDLRVPGAGTLTTTFTPKDGSEPVELEVYEFPGAGVALTMVNLDESIRDFARASFRYGLDRGHPVFLSTRNTVLRKYDGRFKDLFQEVFDAEFAQSFDAAGLTYGHRSTDDMAAAVMAGEGGFVWACKNHDGEVQARAVAEGFGSPGLMTSVLVTPDGRTLLAGPAHGTVTRHYRRHQRSQPVSTDPIASVFAWTRALAHRGSLDGTPDVNRFASALEQACAATVEAGLMTEDLARSAGPGRPWLTTGQFLAAVEENLQKRLVAF
ncbi:NADP-dependent isocitrate dehydrogenase [Streptomyces sp. HMX112]|uniref:NADP-dependent isocitrate dehydrogenase n=1 Tax=Streptomyces sp. HMX112 TaxID=3390850 RepID=UPI003A7FE522